MGLLGSKESQTPNASSDSSFGASLFFALSGIEEGHGHSQSYPGLPVDSKRKFAQLLQANMGAWIVGIVYTVLTIMNLSEASTLDMPP